MEGWGREANGAQHKSIYTTLHAANAEDPLWPNSGILSSFVLDLGRKCLEKA